MSQSPSQHDVSSQDDLHEPFWTPARRRRVLLASIVLLCLVLLVVVPPYIGISRYQRRVTAAISGALGRPVHFDTITLHLLPLPGLTIQNFVVSESPEFGAEPVLRANTVEARLRIGSLWRRRVEVSRISLQAPSVNLVHRRADGRWNLQGILMQASQIQSAPTAQPRAGDAPRFPYIEATDARINFKSDDDKLPFSVKEAEFALWLPEAAEWHLRLTGKPVRTDTDVNDVGPLRVEGTLGRAADLANASIDLNAGWKATPLGEAGKLTMGRDPEWRGEVSGEASLRGTLGQARLVADLHLLALRRAEFVPEHTGEFNAHCEAVTAGLLHRLQDVRCAVPTSDSSSIFSALESLRRQPAANGGDTVPDSSAQPGVLLLRGDAENVLDPHTIRGTASLSGAPASYALAWARVLSRAIPKTLNVGGTFGLTASTAPQGAPASEWSAGITCECVLPPSVESPAKQGTGAPAGVSAQTAPAAPNRWSITLRRGGGAGGTLTGFTGTDFLLLAYPHPATAEEESQPAVPMVPSSSVISGAVTRTGYTLVYGSKAAATQAAALYPPLAEGMPADATGGLKVERTWDLPQVWSTATVPTPRQDGHRRHR